jgi:hypothetical protein
MIVSSEAIKMALLLDTEEEQQVEFRHEGASMFIQGQEVRGLVREWQDFSVDRSKARKLLALLMAMAEQPLTIEYDGNWFTIQEVLV